MNRRTALALTMVALSTAAICAGDAIAQQKTLKEQLVGTWMMLSALNIKADGPSDHIQGTDHAQLP